MRFWVADALRRSGVREYREREHGLTLFLRHNADDAYVFEEVFGWLQHYTPPATVDAALNELQRPLRVLDLGANIGLFGLWCETRWPIEHLTAVEPDPENLALLQRTIQANDLSSRWSVLPAFATTSGGRVHFRGGRSARSRVALAGEPGTEVSAIDILDVIDGVDLLKMDIEGAEWPILHDPRFASIDVPVLVIEFHRHDAPSSEPGTDAVAILERAGYTTSMTRHLVDSDDAFERQGMIWARKNATGEGCAVETDAFATAGSDASEPIGDSGSEG